MNNTLKIIVGVLIILLIAFIGIILTQKSENITSFEDCVEAGYPVMESYPEQCTTPDGERFVRDISGENIACTLDAKLCPDGSYVGRIPPNCEFNLCPGELPKEEIPSDILEHIESKGDLIVVDYPAPFSKITSPLDLRGEARGPWYFEADFPITLVDWDGKIIAEWYVSANLDPNDPESTWMTEDFVPFEGTIEFETPEVWGDEDHFSRRGTLIFHKDNPSGLPENDDALEIPVTF